jgi:hypothetical protein
MKNYVAGKLFKTINIAVITLLLAATLIVSSTQPVGASTEVTINPSADNYLNSSSAYANYNYGSSTSLEVNTSSTGKERAILKFDISNIPAGATITSAQLRLYASTGLSTQTYQVYRITQADSNWVEGTVNGSSQTDSSCWNYKAYNSTSWAGGAGGGSADGGTFVSEDAVEIKGASGWMEWTVTAQVQDFYSLGYNANFLIKDKQEGSGSSKSIFHSKEGANKPQLIINYTVPSTISVTAPSDITCNTFTYGDNINSSTSAGSVTVTTGNDNPTGWSVTAKDINQSSDSGKMLTGGTIPLTDKLQISKDGGTYANADTGVVYTGTGLTGSLPFYAKQNITNGETSGSYTITIEFSGSITY